MLDNKIIFISGASSGIGALVAEMVARRGAIPILTGRDRTKLEAVAQRVKGECSFYQMDVTRNEQVQDTVDKVIAKYGRIDILLNNAGYGKFEYFKAAPIDSFENMMNTNYMGVVRCTKAVLPHMEEQGMGHIINVASMAGKMATSKSTGYSATKHAVLGFTNALRMELKGSGITVSSINPGPIDTPFFAEADPDGTYVKNVGWFMLKPEKVAEKIIYMMEKRRAEVDMPAAAGAGIKLYGLFPRFIDRIFGGLLNRK